MKLSRESRGKSRSANDFAAGGNFCIRLSTIEPRPKRGAFTLLEIMVALFILGLIVAAVYSSWMAVVRGAETGKKAAAEVQRSRIAVRVLEDALTSARMFAADIDYYSFIAENGDAPTLSFVSMLPESFPNSGRFGAFNLRRVTFSVEAGKESSSQLVMRQTPILMDTGAGGERPIVLAKNLRKFEMEFWNTRTADWTDEWTQTNQLPQLIRLTLEFGGDEPNSAVRRTVTKEVALPTVIVGSNWQVPGAPPPGPIIRR
jgi:type II secretion system protein J